MTTCAPSDSGSRDRGTIGDRQFTRIFGDLIVARIETLPDTAAYRERRSQILENAGLTEEDIRAFVDAHGRDSDRMAEVYRRVRARIDTLSIRRAREGASEPLDTAADSMSTR